MKMINRAVIILFSLVLSCGSALEKRNSEQLLRSAEREYLEDGDIRAAERLLARAIDSGAPAPGTHFLMGDLLDATGRPADALENYLKALRQTHRSGAAPHEAVASAMAVVAIRQRVANFESIFLAFLDDLNGDPGKLPPEALFQLRNLELGLAMKRGNPEKIAALLEATDCITSWEVTGPFGPNVWETYDRGENGNLDMTITDPWPTVVDLGPGRGRSQVDTREFSTCTATTGDASLPVEGVGWARSSINLDSPRRLWFRLNTISSARVHVAGQLVHTREVRDGWPSTVSWFEVTVPAGPVDVAVELASPTGPSSFSLLATGDGVMSEGEPRSRTAMLARLRACIWWDDTSGARELLRELGPEDDASPILLAAAAETSQADGSIPGEVAYELARGLMERALDAEPTLWGARLHMASTESSDGRGERAADILGAGMKVCPDEPDIYRRMAQLATTLGWITEADEAVDNLRRLMPDSCLTRAWNLAIARRGNRFDEAARIAREIADCDALSGANGDELTRAQRFEEAMEVNLSIAAMRPRDAALQHDVSRSALAAGSTEAFIRSLRSTLALAPDNPDLIVTLADAQRSLGRTDEARRTLEEALSDLPGPQPVIVRMLANLNGDTIYQDLRLDGLSLILDYKKRAHEYDTASVWVLDRAVHRVADDGSRSEIVHTIAHLKTDEAIELHGELAIPPGALLLKARTVKSDGRILEPESIANKGTISLPDLEPGDFIEAEFVTYYRASPMFPGGFDTERFYFQDFDTAFHRSEMILIAPSGMEIQQDPRGDCPVVDTRQRGDLSFYTWRKRGGVPRNMEPRGPLPSEYLPSIRVSSGATWEAICARTRDLMAHRQRPGEAISQTLIEATVGIDTENSAQRKQAIYHWVMEEIQDDPDLFEQANHILVRKVGNRARALISLLTADGRDARLALVRRLGTDENVTNIPTLDILERAVVMVDGEDWISLDQDGAPYGYLPPELRKRPALFVDTCETTTTGTGSIPRETQDIRVDIVLNPDGSAKAMVVEELTGALAAGWRANLDHIPVNQLERSFQEDYLPGVFRGAALDSLEFENQKDTSQPFVMKYAVTVARFANSKGDFMKAALPFSTSMQDTIGGLPIRNTPVLVAANTLRTSTTTLVIPSGWKFRSRGGQNSHEGAFGEVKRTGTIEGQTFEVSVVTRVSADRVEPSDYDKLLELAREMDQLSRVEITFFPQETHNNLTQ